MRVIELSDDEAEALTAKAAAAGLTLENWLRQLAGTGERTEEKSQPDEPSRPIWEVIVENMKDVPSEVMALMPEDGASQHDHYIYGWPKREV
jgi:hypothetical protein